VQDVLFNALLCQADKDLAEIARALGKDAASFEERAAKTARAMNGKLWDDEHSIYLDFDLAVGRSIYAYVAPNFAGPLFAGIPDERRARRMVSVLERSGFGPPTKASRLCPATIATASRSYRPGTGAGRSGSTLTGSSRRVWIDMATRITPGACKRQSSPYAAMRASTSTSTP
jgi:Mannosylglycerate hydrolase MGH1-like glycoside hydrolase domain